VWSPRSKDCIVTAQRHACEPHRGRLARLGLRRRYQGGFRNGPQDSWIRLGFRGDAGDHDLGDACGLARAAGSAWLDAPRVVMLDDGFAGNATRVPAMTSTVWSPSRSRCQNSVRIARASPPCGWCTSNERPQHERGHPLPLSAPIAD
jgi:hypothetical protein